MIASLLLGLHLLGGACAAVEEPLGGKDVDALFLDMAKLHLGPISSEEDKKRSIYTIQLEKERLMRKTLKGIYEDAFEHYRRGDYEGARELSSKILAVDPSFEDAAILQRASTELKGSPKPYASEMKLIDNRFEEGMALYGQGRLVEAISRWEEASKLAPSNLKVRWWLKKARGEMAQEHFRRGQKAYRQRRLRECLDQWYAALVLNPRYPRLLSFISRVEAEARDADANDKLQAALNLYSQGLIDDSLKTLDAVLEAGPGNSKAQKLQADIRAEMASQHVAQGRKFYEARRYQDAMDEWKKAMAYGYDSRVADQLLSRAREQIRREETLRLHVARLTKSREEARKKAEDEAKAKAAVAQSTATAPSAQAQPSPPQAQPGAVSEDNRAQSQRYYLSGMIYYQKQDFEKARNEWTHAMQLDPSNADAKAGLDRINSRYDAP